MANRQLGAIMFTDIVGYSGLMANYEEKVFDLLSRNRALQKPIIESFNGKWIEEIGDGVLACFNTVTDAVNVATQIQERATGAANFQLRIGVNPGEVVSENDDVLVTELISLHAFNLEKVFGKRDWIEHDPDYDSIRDEPRFKALMEKLK